MSKLKLARLRASKSCKSFSILLREELATGTRMAAWRVPCNSWSCPRCAKKKARELGNRAKDNFKGLHLRFWTLTMKPSPDVGKAIIEINQAWNRIRGKIVRKYGKVKYFKVMEAQSATNMPHFHILVDKFISWHWLKPVAISCGFGSHCFVKDVRDEHVFGYILKYLRKGMSNDTFLEALLNVNGRRVSFSRGVKAPRSPSRFLVNSVFNSRSHPALRSLIFLISPMILDSKFSYPLSSTPDFSEWFFPSPVKLLPPPFPGCHNIERFISGDYSSTRWTRHE